MCVHVHTGGVNRCVWMAAHPSPTDVFSLVQWWVWVTLTQLHELAPQCSRGHRLVDVVSWQLEFCNLLLSSFLLLSSSLAFSVPPMLVQWCLSCSCLRFVYFVRITTRLIGRADTHEKPRRLFAFQEQMVRPTESGLQLRNNVRQLFFFILLSTNFLTVRMSFSTEFLLLQWLCSQLLRFPSWCM